VKARTASERPITIHVLKAKDGQWYLGLVAPNGEIRLVSETYTRKRDAERAAKSLVGLALVLA
jgi:uncharacterized protein YegP (UPF0339 family)